MEEPDRVAIALLAAQVRELAALLGKLNALTGAATEQFTTEHAEISEELLNLFTSVTRIQDRFVPPAPPEEV